MRQLPSVLVTLSIAILVGLYFATTTPQQLSPQGCRMSYMSPSYVRQTAFDGSWSSLASRYTLWLYREVGWDVVQPRGLPVLFIPGNAGSSHQVRSIASSAARQYYSQPSIISPHFKNSKPLDFFAVDFNEDLSAFHGPTMESQITYTSAAISYILSLYPANTTIIIMGHSMGGVVGTSLLPSNDISAVITMSTPHTLPPARFDARVDAIYDYNRKIIDTDLTPIVSLCGGATDLMIPSESCILPPSNSYRRTIFTAALEGSWTGVGHREMVWCHQVRWRLARVGLELQSASTATGRQSVLDKWLRDGQSLPPHFGQNPIPETFVRKILPEGEDLVVKQPTVSMVYFVPMIQRSKFILFVSQGSIGLTAPQHPLPLRVSVYECYSSTGGCDSLQPSTLRLVPNPIPGRPFPVPNEGSDESEGVVFFEADVGSPYVAVVIDGGDGRGWIVGGFASENPIVNGVSTWGLLLGGSNIELSGDNDLARSVHLPNVISNSLLVYELSGDDTHCSDALLPPLLMQSSSPSETHYFPLSRPALLHSHSSAPYVAPLHDNDTGTRITILSTCHQGRINIRLQLDWWLSVGRWAPRFGATLVLWAVGMVALCVFYSWHVSEKMGDVPTVQQSLEWVSGQLVKVMAPAAWVIALLPLPESYFLGTHGQAIFALMAPLLLLLAFGLVYVSWWVLELTLAVSSRVFSRVFSRSRQAVGVKSIVISICLLGMLVFFFIPWQVAFLACWIIHFFTCASMRYSTKFTKNTPLRGDESPVTALRFARDNANHSFHLLLFMTWLLPLTAPVLAVWTRTLVTAGLTTPFDSDHFFLNVAPFLGLVEFTSRAQSPLFPLSRVERYLSIKWFFMVIAGFAFFIGGRKPYMALDVTRLVVSSILVIRIGGRYWRET